MRRRMKQQRQQTGGVCCVRALDGIRARIRGQGRGVQQVKNEDVPLEPSAPLLSILFFLYPLYPPL